MFKANRFLLLLSLLLACQGFAHKVQMAILLDGSGSMQGLIDQTKFQLSRIVNELEGAKKGNEATTLELALIEYGRENISFEQNYMQILSDFNSDLDIVNQKLFQINADGSQEYTGAAIKLAVENMAWIQDPEDFKVIFIAGNETMDQGNIHYRDAITLARAQNIILNTVFAGSLSDSSVETWQEAANLGAGSFANINSNVATENIPTVLDDAILNLNQKLNQTYIIYGPLGGSGFDRMLELDSGMGEYLVDRALTKAGSFYDSSDWDLVDTWQKNKIVIDEQIERSQLNEEMRLMTIEEMIAFLQGKLRDRNAIQISLAHLGKERMKLVNEIMQADGNSESNNLHKAIMAALSRQLEQAGFSL